MDAPSAGFLSTLKAGAGDAEREVFEYEDEALLTPWPERPREQIRKYNARDFSEWRNEDKFRRMFGRLLDGLDSFYK